MGMIAPLSVTTMANTSQNQPSTTNGLNQQPEAAKAPAMMAPRLRWSYKMEGICGVDCVADLLGNGKKEVIGRAARAYYPGAAKTATIGTVLCLNGTTGGLVWSYALGGEISGAPIVADLFGNGTLEIIVGSRGDGVYCLDPSGGIPMIIIVGGVALAVVIVLVAVLLIKKKRHK